MHIRTLVVTVHHCESNWKEEQTVTMLMTDHNKRFELTKVFVQEFNRKVLFSKTNNTLLIPD